MGVDKGYGNGMVTAHADGLVVNVSFTMMADFQHHVRSLINQTVTKPSTRNSSLITPVCIDLVICAATIKNGQEMIT